MNEAAFIALLTLEVGLASLLLGLVPGIGLGWVLAKREFAGRLVLQTVVGLPLVLPPVAVGLVLLLALSPGSPLGAFFRTMGWDVLFTWRAAAIASSVMAFPLLVRSAQQAFASVPERLEKAASTLGSGPWSVFWKVTLPLARRGLVYGIGLFFARALGEFGATTMIAGSIPGRTETLALGIYGRVQRGEQSGALLLTGISFALAFGATYLSEWFLAAGGREQA